MIPGTTSSNFKIVRWYSIDMSEGKERNVNQTFIKFIARCWKGISTTRLSNLAYGMNYYSKGVMVNKIKVQNASDQ
jgi:hypothetical protein